MFIDILKSKLVSLGYSENILKEKLESLDADIIDKKIENKENGAGEIQIIEFDKPSTLFPRYLLDVDENIIQKVVIEGDFRTDTIDAVTNTKMAVVDYSLDKKACIVAINMNFKVEILRYLPSNNIVSQYEGKSYEEIYSEDRRVISSEYLEALTGNGRVTFSKGRDIMNMLLHDFVIDDIAIDGLNPKFKLYDTPEKFADNLTSYQIKYINRRLNRVEMAEKAVYIKRIEKNVTAGFVTNDPYIKLNELTKNTDFILDQVSYYWIFNENGLDEIGIYTAARTTMFGVNSYAEYKKGNNAKLQSVADELAMQFTRIAGYEIKEEFVEAVLEKLNPELVCPSVDIVSRYREDGGADPIEYLKYKYKAFSDPAEFESKLYNSIEDNIGKRYRYNIVETFEDDLTIVGNKLDYTDDDNKTIKKQSIADFNMNSTTVVVKRETLIDSSSIPSLLGYIYEDVESKGTDELPIPNIEVDFFFPLASNITDGVKMYNGTNMEEAISNIANDKKFYENESAQMRASKEEKLPGSTSVTIKYLDVNGDILKENIVNNVFPGMTYIPEIIPVINDKDGKEWVYDNTQITNIVLKDAESLNVVTLKYLKKMTNINVSFVDTKGVKLRADAKENVQVGGEYEVSSHLTVLDKDKNEWNFKTSNPEKFIIKEDEKSNNIMLVYDIQKADVHISYKNKKGEEIAPRKTVSAVADKKYTAKIEPIIIDSNKLAWVYISEAAASTIVKENQENQIELIYDELKVRVTTSFLDSKNKKIKDDVVEFAQAGSKYSAKFEKELEDYEGKSWKIAEGDDRAYKQIIVNQVESENLINVIYEEVLANVKISFINLENKKIKDDETVKAQIGSEFTGEIVDEFTDIQGKVWKCSDKGTALKISKNDNIVKYKYEPLVVKVITKYFDDEREELLPEKVEMVQAGTKYVPEVITKAEDKQGRRWVKNQSKVDEVTVSKLEEENVISIYYDKELTKIKVKFIDVYGKELRKEQEVDAQIGSKFNQRLYDKIEDFEGQKWMLEQTEPKTLLVKAKGTTFTFIYGEVKTLVALRHVDISNSKAITEDIISKVKLGGIYVAEPREKVLDKDKRQWKYVGDKNITITTKENEQENIIVLQYEPDKVAVSVKYIDEQEKEIRNSIDQMIQIGTEVKIKEKDKVFSSDGLGWKLKKSANTEFVVNEDTTKNIVQNIYEPLLSNVITITQNINGDKLDTDRLDRIQVGTTYKPTMKDKIVDENGLGWLVNDITEIKVAEEADKNKIIVSYGKQIANVFKNCVDMDGNLVCEVSTIQKQVGEKYLVDIDDFVTDKNGYEWVYASKNDVKMFADKEKVAPIIVSEDESKNVFKLKYNPHLVGVTIKYIDSLGNQIKKDSKEQAQVGTEFKPDTFENIVDAKGTRWIFNENSKTALKITNNEEDNVIVLAYEEEKAEVIFKYQDENGDTIKEDSKVLVQIGSIYTPNVDTVIEDSSGKVWEYKKRDIEKIEVKEVTQTNTITLMYAPLVVNVILKIQDLRENKIADDIIVKAQLGSEFKPSVEMKVMDSTSKLYEFKKCNPESLKVKENAIGETENINIIRVCYEPVYSLVTVKYQDSNGKELKDAEELQMQVGSIYKVNEIQYIKDREGNQWQLINSGTKKEITVKEDEKSNVVEFSYEIAKTEVIIKYVDSDGNIIKEADKVPEQIGNEFVPETIPFVVDSSGKKWGFFNAEPAKIKVGSINNVIILSYQEVKTTVVIKYQNEDGKTVKTDDRILAQIGRKISPKVSSKVIYDENNIWRYSYSKPEELVVTDDVAQNVIVQYYTDNKEDIKVEGNLLNDTTENQDAEEVKDTTLEKENETPKEESVEKKESSFEFSDENLIKLSKIVALDDDEKVAIQKLNDLNKETISILKEYVNGSGEIDESRIAQITDEEKKTIESGLEEIIQNNKSGSKLLKIFEAITSLTTGNKELDLLQQKKSVLVADYYTTPQTVEIEQVMYICEHGKNKEEIEVINNRLKEVAEKYIGMVREARAIIIYEKVLLDNYYKAKSDVRDNFFNDVTGSGLPTEIIVAVTNMLIKQAYNLFIKGDKLSILQVTEIEAIMKLLNDSQKVTLKSMIDEIPDSKIRKVAQKMYKERRIIRLTSNMLYGTIYMLLGELV